MLNVTNITNLNYKYLDENSALILGDAFETLNILPPEIADVIFSDPPYFLSDNGITCQSGKFSSVNKGDWDKKSSPDEKLKFNRSWINLSRKILKRNGTIWISGTLHNIYSVGMALELENFKIINNITWQKKNPPPNLSRKCFTHSTETILWACKNDCEKYFFNYELMKNLNNNKQMKDVWTGSLTPKSEKIFGKHPTQKPLYLLEKIILASTRENNLIIDPFCGSSTTGIICKKFNRKYIGIDNNPDYINLSIKRLEGMKF